MQHLRPCLRNSSTECLELQILMQCCDVLLRYSALAGFVSSNDSLLLSKKLPKNVLLGEGTLCSFGCLRRQAREMEAW